MTGYPVDVAELAAELAPLIARELEPRRPLLSPREAAEVLGVSERFVRKLIGGSEPRIPSFKIEGARKIDPKDLDAYIEAQRAASESEAA